MIYKNFNGKMEPVYDIKLCNTTVLACNTVSAYTNIAKCTKISPTTLCKKLF